MLVGLAETEGDCVGEAEIDGRAEMVGTVDGVMDGLAVGRAVGTRVGGGTGVGTEVGVLVLGENVGNAVPLTRKPVGGGVAIAGADVGA